jgi:hypothetical protein
MSKSNTLDQGAIDGKVRAATAILDLIATVDVFHHTDGLRKGTLATAALHAADLLDDAQRGPEKEVRKRRAAKAPDSNHQPNAATGGDHV